MNRTHTLRWLAAAVLLAALGSAGLQARGKQLDLSDAQRQELQTLRKSLAEQGADPATCRAEHDKLLQSWGIEPSTCGPGGPHGRREALEKLSPEQRGQLRDLRERLDEQQADPATCRAEHDQLFQSWGMEPPAGGPGGRHGRREALEKLSPEQRKELQALRERLDKQQADPATCRAEHDQLFQSWGMEPPAGGPAGPGGPHGRREALEKLSPEQRGQLRDLRERLDEQQADPATCRAEHDQLFQSWGMEPPAGGPGRAGPGPCRLWENGSGAEQSGALESAGQDEAAASPQLLRGNQPNPFNPTTTIHYTLPQAGEVSLAVYDLSGSLVQSLVQGQQAAGPQQIEWKGLTQEGQPAASGTYLYRLDWQGHSETGRMTLLR